MKVAVCLLALGLTGLAAQETNQQVAVQPPPMTTLPSAGDPAAHTALAGDIMDRLANDPTLSAITITASIADTGEVSLNGVVSSQTLVDQAVAAVRSVPGVKSVTSRILVNQDPFAPPASSSGASLPVRSTDSGSSAVDAANDPQVQLDQALRADPGLTSVSVSLYGARAILLGTVASEQESRRAEQIVRQHLPQHQIDNVIWVDSHPLVKHPTGGQK